MVAAGAGAPACDVGDEGRTGARGAAPERAGFVWSGGRGGCIEFAGRVGDVVVVAAAAAVGVEAEELGRVVARDRGTEEVVGASKEEAAGVGNDGGLAASGASRDDGAARAWACRALAGADAGVLVAADGDPDGDAVAAAVDIDGSAAAGATADDRESGRCEERCRDPEAAAAAAVVRNAARSAALQTRRVHQVQARERQTDGMLVFLERPRTTDGAMIRGQDQDRWPAAQARWILGELLAEATPCSRDMSSAYYFTRFFSKRFPSLSHCGGRGGAGRCDKLLSNAKKV